MRLLLVEDEEKVINFVQRGLEAERFAVDVARDGVTGLELAQTYDYDAVILDLWLPGLDGTEVLRKIRRSDSQVPVLILTARDAVQDKVNHFEAGADDYLTKPFAFAELLVRIKALLRRGATRQETVLRVGDVELDRLSQQVRRGGKRIELTSKEYSLLEYLMANAGIGISEGAQEHIFERFYRTDKARSRRLGGTGLGLSIVKSIGAAHGGKVSVQSSEGRGTIFRFAIPRWTDDEGRSVTSEGMIFTPAKF